MPNKKSAMTRAASIWFQRVRAFSAALLATLGCALVSAQTSVSITSPAQGELISSACGCVYVSGTFGGSALTTISVFNGTSTVLGRQTSANTYTVPSVPLSAGTNTLSITALQRDGTSATASVTVTYPVRQVVLTSPVKNATFTTPASVTFQAEAQVASGSVQRVEYWLLTRQLGSATTPPYTYVWSNPAAGDYVVYARVIDDTGGGTDSDQFSITISPPNQPPAVSLTAPTNGSAFQAPANLTLQANASDPDGTVSLVEFLNNGNLLGATNTAPYSLSLSAQPAGTYSFTARATDNKSAKTTSAPVTVTVTPNTPPAVSLTSPAAGSSYLVPANIQVSADAVAATGSITKVDFAATRSGATPVTATVTSPPYTATLPVTQGGAYALTATAFDSSGASATSSPVTVSVSDGITYLHNDFAGSPIAATDSTGAVVWKENYQPYGSRNNNPPAEAGNRISFHGKPQDQETGLSYFGARYYDPVIGRFMGVDAVRFNEENLQSFNRYAYGNNNPYKYTDPDGRFVTLILRVGVATIAMAGAVTTPEQRERMAQAGDRAFKSLANWVFSDGGDEENSAGEEGCIYCVKGEKTQSGLDYIGSTDNKPQRERDTSDGRDRKGAEVIDTYPKGDRDARRRKEQQAINDKGGIDKLDNKRNEVAEKKWPSKGITP